MYQTCTLTTLCNIINQNAKYVVRPAVLVKQGHKATVPESTNGHITLIYVVFSVHL